MSSRFEGHTKGPWRVEYNGSYGPWVNSTHGNDPDYGTAAHELGHETHSIATPHGPTAKANAALIAAAPDLLALCEQIREALRRSYPWLGKLIAGGGHLDSVLPKDAERSLDMAEAALAAADKLLGKEAK